MLFANAPAILVAAFPPTERGRALGLQAVMTYLGLSAGPPLGGLLATHFGWRAIFFVNVPVGLLGYYLAQRNVARDRPRGAHPRFDMLGAALFFVGLLSLLLALDQAHAWGWLSAPTLGLLGLATAALCGFAAVERRREEPMLDLSLFGSRVFSGAVASACLSYVAQFAVMFLLPFYLAFRGLGPDQAGLVLTAQPLAMAATAPLAGALSDRLGTRGPVVLGLLVLATSILLLAGAGPATPIPLVAAGLALSGLGFGAFVAPNNSRLLGAAPGNRRGIASGVLAAARNTGMVLGVGLAGALFTTALSRRGAGAVPEAMALALRVVAATTFFAAVTSFLEGSGRRARDRSLSA